MKKILLPFVLLLACVGSWAQVLNFTFTRSRENTTVNVTGADGVTATITATSPKPQNNITTTGVWNTGDKMATDTNVLCTSTNSKDATNDAPITYTLTINGLATNQAFNAVTFVSKAVSGGGAYQSANTNSKHYCNFSLTANETTIETKEQVGIMVKSSAGETKEVAFEANDVLAVEGKLVLTLKIWNHSDNPGCFYGLTEIKLNLVNLLVSDVIPSGFYRFKHVSSSKYLAAPEVLPTENTREQSYSVTLVDNIEENDKHRDVWYIEKLGYHTDETKGVMYRVWCFQGGYGLSCYGSPQVFGSFTNGYCPRLYSIVKTTEGNYTLAGHYNDVNSNPLELDNTTGISNTAPVKVTISDNSPTFSRTGSSTDADSQWKIFPVAPISKNVTIDDIGVGTFAFNSDVKIPEGIEAYVATEREERIGLTKLEGTIPARMGVVLRKTDESKNDFQFEAVHGLGIGMKAVGIGGSETSVDDKGNLLVGTLAETSLDEGDYILAVKKNTENEVVFGRISKASNIAANKAYLPAEAVSQTRGFYTLMWGDVETGIEEIAGTVQKDGIFVEGQQIVIVKNGLKYNAKGQRVK